MAKPTYNKVLVTREQARALSLGHTVTIDKNDTILEIDRGDEPDPRTLYKVTVKTDLFIYAEDGYDALDIAVSSMYEHYQTIDTKEDEFEWEEITSIKQVPKCWRNGIPYHDVTTRLAQPPEIKDILK